MIAKPKVSGDPEELVELLVMHDPNDEAQWRRASAAVARLRELELKSLPALIAHATDSRKSWPTWQGQYDHHVTVGDLCVDIITEQIEDPSVLSRLHRKQGYLRLTPSPTAWWAARTNRTMRELRLEALLLLLEEERGLPDYAGKESDLQFLEKKAADLAHSQ